MLQSVEEEEEEGVRGIGVPAVGGGVYGFVVQVCGGGSGSVSGRGNEQVACFADHLAPHGVMREIGQHQTHAHHVEGTSRKTQFITEEVSLLHRVVGWVQIDSCAIKCGCVGGVADRVVAGANV